MQDPNFKTLRNAANIAFGLLSPKAGLNSHSFKCTQEWIKNDRNRLHIVQRYDNDKDQKVILKLALKPQGESKFHAILKNHMNAASVLEGNIHSCVPTILATDSSKRAYLMEFIEGKTILSLCEDVDDHTDVMERAGKWLSDFHRGTFQEARKFQPKFMADHALKLADKIKQQKPEIDEPQAFMQYANRLQSYKDKAAGCPSIIAAKHGDLNMRNLILSDQKMVALDFHPLTFAPVGYDIARLLLSYAHMVGNLNNIPDGQVIRPEIAEAFWSGYSFLDRENPSIDFLIKSQILMDWNSMPRTNTLAREIRFARLMEIARIAFSA